jgi:hypothetical protein
MKFFKQSKDGGPESPVDAFFLFEIKSLGSIALLRFNEGAREAYHTHAFNALTWFLRGDLTEEDKDGTYHVYRRSWLPKITRRTKNHRVIAWTTSWCLTIRGPWAKTWTEDTDTHRTVLTHGREIVTRIEK